jgi:hypothetical protein
MIWFILLLLHFSHLSNAQISVDQMSVDEVGGIDEDGKLWLACLHTTKMLHCRTRWQDEDYWTPIHEAEFVLHDAWPKPLRKGSLGRNVPVPRPSLLFQGRAWTLDGSHGEEVLLSHGIYYRIISDTIGSVREIRIEFVEKEEFEKFSAAGEHVHPKILHAQNEYLALPNSHSQKKSLIPISVLVGVVSGYLYWHFGRFQRKHKESIKSRIAPRKIRKRHVRSFSQPFVKRPDSEITLVPFNSSLPVEIIEFVEDIGQIGGQVPPAEVKPILQHHDSHTTLVPSQPSSPSPASLPSLPASPFPTSQNIESPLENPVVSKDAEQVNEETLSRQVTQSPTLMEEWNLVEEVLVQQVLPKTPKRSKSPLPSSIQTRQKSKRTMSLGSPFDSPQTVLNSPNVSTGTETMGWSPFSSRVSLSIPHHGENSGTHFLARRFLDNVDPWHPTDFTQTDLNKRGVDTTWLQREEERVLKSYNF